MKVKVLFDKISTDKDIHTGWGVSFLINESFLFDTGENGRYLIDNMNKMNVNIEKINYIAISHDHWDHTGGLWEILKIKKMKVIGCGCFSSDFKEKVKSYGSEFITSEAFKEYENGVFLTGEIPGNYKGIYMGEQALVLSTKNGISVLTGCAHPGIIEILLKTAEFFGNKEFYLVGGGFHLMNKTLLEIKFIIDEFKFLNVKKAAPTHCSGNEAEQIFDNIYKNNFLRIKAGLTIEI